MTARRGFHQALGAWGLALALPCLAEPPPLNLELRFRQVDGEPAVHEAPGAGSARNDLTVSTRAPSAQRSWLQQLQVMNGEWGALRIGRALPLQWTRAVTGAASPSAKAGSAAGGVRGAVVDDITWLQAGQSLAVRVRWPGGAKPAVLDIRVDVDQVGERTGSEMPRTGQSQVATTVSVPLERWITFASNPIEGGADAGATLSTQALRGPARQQFQVFVHVP